MHVGIVYSQASGSMAAIVADQKRGLEEQGCQVTDFVIEKSGLKSYLRAYWQLRKYIRNTKPDLILANFGLVCMLSNMQRKVPVVSMYHGSDIHFKPVRYISYIASRLSRYNIFVHPRQQVLLNYSKPNYSILPCGYDDTKISAINKEEAKAQLGFDKEKSYVLFPSSFDRPVKNPELAISVVSALDNVELIELKGYDKMGVNLVLNAVDLVLLTSHYETGPLVVKEAMAVGTPVISVNVGDVALLYGHLKHCYVVSHDVQELRSQVVKVIGEIGEIDKKNDYAKLVALSQVSIYLKNILTSVLERTDKEPFDYYQYISK